MSDISQLQEIAGELRRLQSASAEIQDAPAVWHEQSRRFANRLGSDFSNVDLPEEIWHYLHDADLRVKDPRHKRMQDRMMDEVIADLERGIVPAPRGTTVSFHPRWIGAAGLLLISLIVYWTVR